MYKYLYIYIYIYDCVDMKTIILLYYHEFLVYIIALPTILVIFYLARKKWKVCVKIVLACKK